VAGTPASATNPAAVEASVREIPELELALLKRSVDNLVAGRERCGHCDRTPLIGERVYVYDSGAIACELCRSHQPATPIAARIVHGPEFGQTMRISARAARYRPPGRPRNVARPAA